MKKKINSKKDKKGFTIIELLVAIGIVIMLSGSLFFYSRTIEQQIILAREQVKIISTLYRAKSLAINTFISGDLVCGYGVNFTVPRTMILFKELPLSQDCSDADGVYSGENEKFQSFDLDKVVEFSELGLNNIVFIPPDPIISIDNSLSKTEALITIKTLDNKATSTIKITNAGQITTQ